MSWRSTAGGQQRSRKPQPEHFETADVLVRLALRDRGAASISSKVASASLAAVVFDVEDLAGAGVDLERDRRLAEGLLVEPAVDLELQRRRAPVGRADAAVELRVADRVAAARGQHEVGQADDLDLAAGELGLGAHRALVDHALAGVDRIDRRCRGSSSGSGPRSRCVGKALEVAAPRARARGASAARRRRPAGVSSTPWLAQPHPQPAARGPQVAVEVAGDEAGEGWFLIDLGDRQSLLIVSERLRMVIGRPTRARQRPRRFRCAGDYAPADAFISAAGKLIRSTSCVVARSKFCRPSVHL